jgi:ABC-2 type transport system ATP-binding protein
MLTQGVTIVMSTAYLDEAERCGRVGLLHQGRLLAVDTPANVRALLRADMVEITVADAWRAREALAALPEAREVTVFGQHVHVALTDAARDLPIVLSRLEGAGVPARKSRRIRPSLEDAFVSVMADSAARPGSGGA